MSLPQGKTPVWNQIKTHILCSTLLRILIPFAPHFDPLCSAFWSFAPHFDPIAPHFDLHHSTSAPQLSPSLLSLKLTDTRFFKARAQHISWGHVRHRSVTLRHCSDTLRHLRHAPTRSDTPAFYSAPHSSPKLRRFWHLFSFKYQMGLEKEGKAIPSYSKCLKVTSNSKKRVKFYFKIYIIHSNVL